LINETAFGLKKEQIENIRSVLYTEKTLDEVILFGSRAKGNFKPGSDIDLALKGESLDLNIILSLMKKLDDLNLPFKFDLLIFEKIKDEDVIDHIKRAGISFYKKNKD